MFGYVKKININWLDKEKRVTTNFKILFLSKSVFIRVYNSVNIKINNYEEMKKKIV